MSRSYRKVPAGSPRSEKEFRTEANRKLRHKTVVVTKEILKDVEVVDEVVFPVTNEVSNIYDSPKDGGYHYTSKNDPWFDRVIRK